MLLDFDELLVSGKFGIIGPETKQEEILKLFGELEGIASENQANSTGLKYKDLEIWLEKDKLGHIAMNIPLELPNVIQLKESKILSNRGKFSEIRDCLKARNIVWKQDTIMTDEYQTVYVTEKEIHMVFSKQEILGRVGVNYIYSFFSNLK